MSGILYIVPTPIGNLEDITLRALRILAEVDVVLCEDTRTSSKLLRHYDISTSTMSYHAHSDKTRAEKIIQMLVDGRDLALVSDAGTPGISDPGFALVSRIRQEFSGIDVVALPGASALTTALSAAGLPTHAALFVGFLPAKKGRESMMDMIQESRTTIVAYEAPRRLEKLLTSLHQRIPERTVVIARELTKIHEEYLRGTPSELLEALAAEPEKLRGECVVLIEGRGGKVYQG